MNIQIVQIIPDNTGPIDCGNQDDTQDEIQDDIKDDIKDDTQDDIKDMRSQGGISGGL